MKLPNRILRVSHHTMETSLRNPDMENNDVVLVVGANDVVNSAAQAGMKSRRFPYEPRKKGPWLGWVWLGYIGDEILPSYIGIIINHYKDPH